MAAWAVGLIDFTAGAIRARPENAAFKQRWRLGDLERFDNLAVNAVVT
jgi:hypothetical protein